MLVPRANYVGLSFDGRRYDWIVVWVRCYDRGYLRRMDQEAGVTDRLHLGVDTQFIEAMNPADSLVTEHTPQFVEKELRGDQNVLARE